MDTERDPNRSDEQWIQFQQELSAAADVILDRELANGVPFSEALCSMATYEALRTISARIITD